MKIVTIVGARPQFIKAAAVSKILRQEIEEILVHTGQHYDNDMSDIFFEELGIPKPKYNLGVGSGTHARQTASMLVGIEDIIQKENPDAMIVYGDTNSTLAGALAASKLLIPVIHIEAGLRSFNKNMPEEQNRIITDHLSSLLFCSSDVAVQNLANENINKNVYHCGDVMCDAVSLFSQIADQRSKKEVFSSIKPQFGQILCCDKWCIATIHRAENTDDAEKIAQILGAFEEFDYPVIFPVHPRTLKLVKGFQEENYYKNIFFIKPVGYLDMLYLTKNAELIITDSGGLQKEAYILKTPCITIREQTEWIETLNGGWNTLAHPNKQDILEKVRGLSVDYGNHPDYYGDGNAGLQICREIVAFGQGGWKS